MRISKAASALAFTAFLATGCDPEAPVQSSNVTDEINGAVAAHAADPTTHTNLLFPAANIDGEITADQIEDGAIGIAEIDTGAVGSDEIADQSIALVDLSANSVGPLQIVADAIDTTKIAANTITAADIAAGAITGGVMGAIADDTITGADIQNGSVTGADVNDGTIASADITDNTLTGADIADNILTDADIMDDALTAASLATNSVGQNELANDAVDQAAMRDDSVGTNEIVDANVTAAKLADGSVAAYAAKLSIPDVLGAGTAGAAFNTVFTMRVPNNGTVVRVVAGCESDQDASMLRLQDNNQMVDVTCPDTNLMGPMSLFILEVTTNMANEDVLFRYKSEANGDTTRWRIFGVTAQ